MNLGFVSVRCEYCTREIKLNPKLLGRSAKCPGCGVSTRLQIDRAAQRLIDTSEISFQSIDTKDSSTDLGPKKETPVTPAHNLVANAAQGSQASIANSEKLGRFQLQRKLGRGGFGEVWEAFDLNLDRRVAVKLPIFPPTDQKRSRRFVTEAQAAARLAHPNIVAVYDAGVIDSRHYLAIEFIDGKSLDQVAAQSKIPISVTVKLVHDLAQALHYAHEESIVHRDIKPQNIVLGQDGIPKIVDFGLAKLLEKDSGQTVDGMILGTPAYMAPEQARGDLQSIGPHTDQYSLGAVLYWLITQSIPFTGPHVSVIYQVIHNEPPKPSTLSPDIDPRLEAICLKAMSKSPRDRYQNCNDFAQDLKRFAANKDVLAKPPTILRQVSRSLRQNPIEAILMIGMIATLAITFTMSAIGFVKSTSLARSAEVTRLTTLAELDKQRKMETDLVAQLAEVEKAKQSAMNAKETAEQKQQEALAAIKEVELLESINKSLDETRNARAKELKAAEALDLNKNNSIVSNVVTIKSEDASTVVPKSAAPLMDIKIHNTGPEISDGDNLFLKSLKPIPSLIESKNWVQASNHLQAIPLPERNLFWKLFSHIVRQKNEVLRFNDAPPAISKNRENLFWEPRSKLFVTCKPDGSFQYLDRETFKEVGVEKKTKNLRSSPPSAWNAQNTLKKCYYDRENDELFGRYFNNRSGVDVSGPHQAGARFLNSWILGQPNTKSVFAFDIKDDQTLALLEFVEPAWEERRTEKLLDLKPIFLDMIHEVGTSRVFMLHGTLLNPPAQDEKNRRETDTVYITLLGDLSNSPQIILAKSEDEAFKMIPAADRTGFPSLRSRSMRQGLNMYQDKRFLSGGQPRLNGPDGQPIGPDGHWYLNCQYSSPSISMNYPIKTSMDVFVSFEDIRVLHRSIEQSKRPYNTQTNLSSQNSLYPVTVLFDNEACIYVAWNDKLMTCKLDFGQQD